MVALYKPDGHFYEIYDITYDSCGYPQFLVYLDNKWCQISAQFFTPGPLKMDWEKILK